MPKPTKRATSAARVAVTPTPVRPTVAGSGKDVSQEQSKTRAARKDGRSDELRFKVTEAFRQRFKQTAKDLGIKKSALLERLLAEWHDRRSADGRVEKTARDDAKPTQKPATLKPKPASRSRPGAS